MYGTGKHSYDIVENWGTLPDHINLGYTHGVCVDSLGRIYIHNQSRHSMVVFSPEGDFITSWGPEFARGAHGLTIHNENGQEFLYLADEHLCEVIKATLDGNVVWRIKKPDGSNVYTEGMKFVPTNTAVAPNGDIYVADGYGSSFVHQFNSNAEYIRTWGGKGTLTGQFDCPHGICIDDRDGEPKVLVADRGNVRLQWFTLDGRHIKTIAKDLRHPCHFSIHGGDLLIPDLFGRLTIFNSDNELVTHIGVDADSTEWTKPDGYPNVPRESLVPGKFISPHSACWDHAGNIYVVEWIEYGRITKLKRI